MAKKIEICMFCEATPCECEGTAKPKRTRAPRKKADNVDEPRSSSGRVRKPRASVEPDVAGKKAVDEIDNGRGGRVESPRHDGLLRGPFVAEAVRPAPVRERTPSTPDEVRATRTLHFFGMLAREEVEKRKDMLTITVEGKLLGEV